MKKQDGLTLIEVILAIALLGIISVSFLSVFASQLKNIVKGGEITQGAFDDQGIVEEIIYDAKYKIQHGEDMSGIPQWSAVSDIEIFEQTVTMQKLKYESAHSANRDFTVYLSSELANKEINVVLNVQGVAIQVSTDPNNEVADLTNAPTLAAQHQDNSNQIGYFTNIYRWWRTQPGVDPSTLSFPNDYVLISVPQDTKSLTNLLDNVGANSYVVLTVTPVDVNGNRGSSVMSSNMVYVRGAEWRIETFPWVDIDNNYEFDSIDHKLIKESIVNQLDAQNPFPNPLEPSTNLDLQDGSLFVPMGIAPVNLNEPGNQAIEVIGSERIEWLIERNINLAKDFVVLNGSDIKLVSGLGSNGGTIFVHPYVRLDAEGKPVVVGGVPELLNTGVTMSTTGNIDFETAGRGSIQFYNKAELQGNNISLRARGAIGIDNSIIRANNSVYFNNNLDTYIPGSRKITLLETNFEGATSGSAISFNSPEEVYYKGGSWSSNQIVKIANDKSIYFEKGINRVNNLGLLDLGNTGSVRFKSSMITDLSNQLKLRVVKKSDAEIRLIPHNYLRNIAYSSAATNIVFSSSNIWKNIGGSTSNIEFSAVTVSGTGNVGDIKYSFNGIDAITISQNSTRPTATTRVRLEFRDKYSNREIKGIGFFTYSIDVNGHATITVEDEVPVDTYRITFDSDGGTQVSDIIKAYGDPIAYPPEPTRSGYRFVGWDPSLPEYMPNSNLNVIAQWLPNEYKVTFDSQGGVPAETVQDVVYGQPYGNVFPPSKTGHKFDGWFTSPSGGDLVDLAQSYELTGDSRLYAHWSLETYNVIFNSNGGSRPNPSSKSVTYGSAYGDLPVVTRDSFTFNGWYTAVSAGELIDSLTQVKPLNLTLYARWIQVPKLEVVLQSNGRNSFTLTFNNELVSIVETNLGSSSVVVSSNEVIFSASSGLSTGEYYVIVKDTYNQTRRVNLRLTRSWSWWQWDYIYTWSLS